MITINPSVFQLGGIDNQELGRSIFPSVDETLQSPITPVVENLLLNEDETYIITEDSKNIVL